MASLLDRNDGETASSWLNRLDGVDQALLDASDLSDPQALRQQAGAEASKETGDEINAQAVARQTGRQPRSTKPASSKLTRE
jgi:hypothetical protein